MRALKKQDSWMWWWQIWEDLSSPLFSQRSFLSFPARSGSLITLHDGQDLVSLGLSQRPVGRPVPTVEPADSLWVQGSQQSDVEEDESRAAQQQARPAFVSNVLPSVLRHNATVEFATPQSPPGAQLTSGEPTSEYSQQNRCDQHFVNPTLCCCLFLIQSVKGKKRSELDNSGKLTSSDKMMPGTMNLTSIWRT
jgi:hypothetical protein